MTRKGPFEQPLVKFDNRVAVVTGSCGNIGVAICKMLAEYGVRVVATDLSEEVLAERFSRPTGTLSGIHTCRMDVTDPESVRGAFGKILEKFGKGANQCLR